MVTLVDLGFNKNIIYETIVCTYNQDGSPNAAPIGVIVEDVCQVNFVIYNSASTLKNLQSHRLATLNLTGNLDIFFHTALKDTRLPLEWFEKSNQIDAPQLKIADATIAVTIENFSALDGQRTKVVGKVCHITALKRYPQSYCRAAAAVLEAIIHTTRIKALYNVESEQEYVNKLLNLIKTCHEVVNRSAPNSHYAELMFALQQKINTWSVKHENLC